MTTKWFQKGDKIRVISKHSPFYGREGIVERRSFDIGYGFRYYVAFNQEPEELQIRFFPEDIEKVTP